jgi:hormone-sensitive lipase
VDVSKESINPQGLLTSAVSSIKNVIVGSTSCEEDHNDSNNNNNEKHADTLKRNYAFTEKKQTNEIPKAAEDEFIFSVPKNYLMSPYLAPDDILKQFPKVNILTTIVDPCIDDCIEFSKKLKKLNVDIELDIVGALNHGFLNFSNVRHPVDFVYEWEQFSDNLGWLTD